MVVKRKSKNPTRQGELEKRLVECNRFIERVALALEKPKSHSDRRRLIDTQQGLLADRNALMLELEQFELDALSPSPETADELAGSW